jgi:hypothetical protein
LVYKKDFPYFAYERVIMTGLGECYANESDDYPTCGWQTEGTQRIKHSQGFCCECELSWTQKYTRGSQCENGFLEFLSDEAASAHCLSFSTQEFRAYTVEAPKLSFGINV